MFRASSRPSSGATTTAVAASGLSTVIKRYCYVNLQLQTDKRYYFRGTGITRGNVVTYLQPYL
jgi:hypothetical protein